MLGFCTKAARQYFCFWWNGAKFHLPLGEVQTQEVLVNTLNLIQEQQFVKWIFGRFELCRTVFSFLFFFFWANFLLFWWYPQIFLPLKLNFLFDHHHSCEICCGMICHTHFTSRKLKKENTAAHIERVVWILKGFLSKLQRANKSKRERERKKEVKRKGRGREVSCLWNNNNNNNNNNQGQSDFLGQIFGQTGKKNWGIE